MSKGLSIGERIKRCPFCGGEAKVENLVDHVWIECRKCGAKSDSVRNSPYHASAEVALEKWNARMSDEQMLDKSLLYGEWGERGDK